MASRSLLVVSSAFMIVAASACGETGAGPGAEAGGPVVTALETEDGADGPIDGVLELRDGCLVVDGDPEVGAGLALLPFGTTWDDTTSTVTHPSGQSVSVGSKLSGTGEGHPVADLVPWFVTDAEQAQLRRCADATGIDDVRVIGWFEPGIEHPPPDVTTT